jgi:hypothetical protein
MPFELQIVQIRRNPKYDGGTSTPRYFFDIDLSQVVRKGVSASLPVFWRPNKFPHPQLKEFYWTQVAGITLEKGNLAALEKIVPQAIVGLIDFGTIPYYYLTLPGGDRFPVYYSEGKLQLRLRGEPSFSGEDIGQLWRRISDYLSAQKKNFSREELEVSLLLWKDLKLYPAAFVFQNGKSWIPIFYSQQGEEFQLIYDLIGLPSRILPLEDAFELRREVARSLTSLRLLSSPFDLKMVQVQPEIWSRLEEKVSPTGFVLSYSSDGVKEELPIYQAGEEVFATSSSSKMRMIFSQDIEELLRRVSEELTRQGKLPNASYLSIERRRG